MTHLGGCLCGAVRYEITGAAARVFACFCRDCQQAGGSLFHHGVQVAETDFKIKQGELTAYTSKSDGGRDIVRYFCPTCGSGIYNAPTVLPGMVVLRGGTLDDPKPFTPSLSIFNESKPDWVDLPGVQNAYDRRPG